MGRHRQRQAPWCGEGRVGDDLERKTLSEHEISASLFGQHVLSAYFSCLPSEANGYLAASELRKSWVTPDDATWYVEGNLDEVAIDDYAVSSTPAEDYEECYSLAEKSYETNAWEN